MKTNIKRALKRLYVKWYSRSRPDNNFSRPKNLDSEETLALDIWIKICHKPESLLLYDPEKRECYAILQDEEHPIYLFLETQGMRIVNSTVGYTVPLGNRSDQWCTNIFFREVSKRRRALKKAALGRVTHSLEGLTKYIQSTH